MSWHNEKRDRNVRRTITTRLTRYLSQGRGFPNPLEKAREIEKVLYQEASSLKVYKNPGTLHNRLRAAMIASLSPAARERAESDDFDPAEEEEEPSAAAEEPRRGLIWQYLDSGAEVQSALTRLPLSAL
jgi:hypothetical protein